MTEPPTTLPDLASRALGGTVLAASDEFFAAKENLITPAAPTFQPQTFDARGQIYDGWETRRRRTPGHDWVIVRLGAPGIIHAVVVDTAFFEGNFPACCAVDGLAVAGYPDTADLPDAEWVELVPESPLEGNTARTFKVTGTHRFTHVRLRTFPDGGVARLRVHGEALPDPHDLTGLPVDLIALANGGRTLACSNDFYSTPDNLLLPDPARVTGEGWETARRRDDGNDWVVVGLGVAGVPAVAEIDTRCFIGNAPAAVTLTGLDDRTTDPADPAAWTPLLIGSRTVPNTRHRFHLRAAGPVTRVRLDIFPDGGLARFRLYGTPDPAALDTLTRRWRRATPTG